MASLSDDSIIESDTNQVECINIGAAMVRFEIDGNKYKLGPGMVVSLHRAYARPRSMQPGKDPVPSAVELLTARQVLPIDDPRAAAAVRASQARGRG